MWLGERITDKGIGNGISLIIMIGIVARMPASFIFESGARLNGAGGAVALIVEIVVLFVVILATILGTGNKACTCSVCQTNSRKQTIWRSTPVHPS